MNTKHPSLLHAQVAARNGVNKMVHDMVPRLQSVLRQFFGKKIYLRSKGKFTDALINAVNAEFGEFPCNGKCHIYLGIEPYSDHYNVKFYFSLSEWYDTGISDGHADYRNFYSVARFNNEGVLQGLETINLDNLRTDYKTENILEVRAELKEAQKKVDAIKSRLCGFGE